MILANDIEFRFGESDLELILCTCFTFVFGLAFTNISFPLPQCVVDFGTDETEQTLLLLKPDAVQRALIGRVIERFESKGLKLVGLKFLWVSAT